MPKEHTELDDFNRLRRHLRIASAALVIVTMVGIVGFAAIGGDRHGLIDAVYMTVITLTTVGFGEIIDMSSSPSGRVFTVVLLLFGMAIVLYSVPMLAAFVIEGRLLNLFARRRMEKRISAMQGHFIVGGYSSVADYVAGELMRTGRDVVQVHAEDVPEAPDAVPHVVGDPTVNDSLMEAGIERAMGVVMATPSEKDNILGVFTARRLSSSVRIVAAGESRENVAKLRAAGADAVVSPSKIGGLRMASELVRPTVVSFLDKMLRDERQSLRVEEVDIAATSPVLGDYLDSLSIDDLDGVVLLALRRAAGDQFTFKPPGDTILESGMKLVVMTDAAGRDRLENRVS
ncbi:MAG: potassium channel family protein [Gemmatimonadales bacterium]